MTTLVRTTSSLLGAGSLLLLLAQPVIAQMPRTTSPEGAEVYFISPSDGLHTEDGQVHVVFGLRGMGVAPAGIEYPDSGHHHLLLNAEELPAFDTPIPSDERHLHFGMGQTETMLDLEPGTHTLQLILGDMNHVPHDPPVVSEKITITVE